MRNDQKNPVKNTSKSIVLGFAAAAIGISTVFIAASLPANAAYDTASLSSSPSSRIVAEDIIRP